MTVDPTTAKSAWTLASIRDGWTRSGSGQLMSPGATTLTVDRPTASSRPRRGASKSHHFWPWAIQDLRTASGRTGPKRPVRAVGKHAAFRSLDRGRSVGSLLVGRDCWRFRWASSGFVQGLFRWYRVVFRRRGMRGGNCFCGRGRVAWQSRDKSVLIPRVACDADVTAVTQDGTPAGRHVRELCVEFGTLLLHRIDSPIVTDRSPIGTNSTRGHLTEPRSLPAIPLSQS